MLNAGSAAVEALQEQQVLFFPITFVNLTISMMEVQTRQPYSPCSQLVVTIPSWGGDKVVCQSSVFLTNYVVLSVRPVTVLHPE